MSKVFIFFLVLLSFAFSNDENNLKEAKPKKFVVQRIPIFSTYVLWCNINDPKINKAYFCRGLSFAIQRNYIIEMILNEEAYGPSIYGISSPALIKSGYDISEIKGYSFNLDSAKYYLKKSGVVPAQKSFLLISNSSGERSCSPLEELQKE